MKRRWRWWAWLILFAGVALVARFAFGFPWGATAKAVLDTAPGPLLIAILLNLLALVAKGWAWHLLLLPVAPNRWRTAQEAMMIGSAVNSLSVSVSGEAARVHHLVQRDGVSIAPAISSVVWSRVVEAIALAVFLLLVAWFFPLPPWMQTVRLVFGVALVAVAGVTLFGGWEPIVRGIPPKLGGWLKPLVEVATRSRLGWPVLLDLLNWFAEWATFHLCIVATGTPVPIVVSLMALVASNIVGAPRLTPANIGVLQASVVAGMVPFGIPAERAVAAGLVLQAAQVLPVLAVAAMILGWKGLRSAAIAPSTLAKETR